MLRTCSLITPRTARLSTKASKQDLDPKSAMHKFPSFCFSNKLQFFIFVGKTDGKTTQMLKMKTNVSSKTPEFVARKVILEFLESGRFKIHQNDYSPL